MKRKTLAASMAVLMTAAVLAAGCGGRPAGGAGSTESLDMIEAIPETKESTGTADSTDALPSVMPDGTMEAGSSAAAFPEESYVDAVGEVDAFPKTAPLKVEPGLELLSEGGISITVTGTELSAIRGRGITCLVRNSNDFPVLMEGDYMVVNDCTTYDSVSWNVDAGGEKECTCYIWEDSMEKAGYTSVSRLEVPLTAMNWETLEPLWTRTLVLDMGEEEQTARVRGELLYESDTLRIFGEYVTDDPIWGSGLLITAQNLSDVAVDVRAAEASADGQYMRAALSIYCRPGTYGFGKQNYTRAILEENGQDSFETAGIVLAAWADEAFEPGETTGLLEVPVSGSPEAES